MSDPNPTANPIPEMLTVRATAARLSLSLTATYQLIREGKFPHYRIGGAIRISVTDIETFLAGCRQEQPTAIVRPRQTRLRHVKLAR